MSEKGKPLVFKSRSKIKDNGLSPSTLDLYDLMNLTSCASAEMKWKPDWAFCPVCFVSVTETGDCFHKDPALMPKERLT